MNVWSFTGNIGREPEHRVTPKGESVVSISVAVKSGYGDKAVTTWANCNLWGKRYEAVSQHLAKGQLVGIVGEPTLREWEAKDGSKGKTLEVRVSDITLLGKAEKSKEPEYEDSSIPF